MPLFMYAFPVTLISGIWLTIASAIFESHLEGYQGVFGWFHLPSFWVVLYLAIGPGFIGHTGLNTILKYIDPIVISVLLLLEPPVGAVIGWIAGVSGLPALFTFLGGPLIIAGCLLVILSAYKRTSKEATEEFEKHNIELNPLVEDEVLKDENPFEKKKKEIEEKGKVIIKKDPENCSPKNEKENSVLKKRVS
eukprot:TRINITY_DN13439_c0_g2_i1.p2 TRINITY_DN13439_c0_g2~~TRINITY_DN13439_c0_g2_i1.p2  ORF type:complete len:193 (+),score=33.70 TRINITY_DN13439_c0_g2_i1:873-1451(+)